MLPSTYPWSPVMVGPNYGLPLAVHELDAIGLSYENPILYFSSDSSLFESYNADFNPSSATLFGL